MRVGEDSFGPIALLWKNYSNTWGRTCFKAQLFCVSGSSEEMNKNATELHGRNGNGKENV